MSRIDLARSHLAAIIQRTHLLAVERENLKKAAQRLAEIAQEIKDLDADATEALAKYNSLSGENLTLADVKARYVLPGGPPVFAEPPPAQP